MLLMHPGRLRGKVRGKLPLAPWRLGAPPVEYKKLETYF